MTRILISNDDGVHAYGLPPLIEALTPLGEVWVCLLYTSDAADE